MSKVYGAKIVHTGMGGFLCPPGHPAHEWRVETGRSGNPNGCYSLESAIKCDYLPATIRGRASGLLKRWGANKLPLTDATVREWVKRTLGYFRGCYAGMNAQGEYSWDVSDLRIDRKCDPLLNASLHAGVRMVRVYYPEYQPSAEDFAQAYWGTKLIAA